MQLRSAVISALFLLTACDSVNSTMGSGDKYPYPVQFVSAKEFPDRLLAVPPAKGSPEFESEIQTIVARQAKLTDADKQAIQEEDHIVPELLVLPVLGAQYTPEHYPALYTLLKHVSSDAWRICDTAQDYYMSPRPWVADARVQLIAPKITRYGYPSGHTATNTVWAYTLAEIFPDKRDALVARANQIAEHRVDGGVHFPHDIQGGRDLAGLVFGKMKANPQFQKELETAKREIAATAQVPQAFLIPSPAWQYALAGSLN